jgi:hypothetical protein
VVVGEPGFDIDEIDDLEEVSSNGVRDLT